MSDGAPESHSPDDNEGLAAEQAIFELQQDLERRFRTRESLVETANGEYTIMHPANPDDLISEEDFDRDERLPYWADIWPSSITLAGSLGRFTGPEGGRLLELGCGSGLLSSAAARLGFAVTATDYYDDALRFARLNAWRNARHLITTRHVDWRSLPPDLGRFDVVVACDVLYEPKHSALVANVFTETLFPSAVGILADPGRVALEGFLKECARRGLVVNKAATLPFVAGEIRQSIGVYTIKWEE